MTIGSAKGCGTCPVAGCKHGAELKYGGACERHYRAKYKNTSDGVHTGRTPKLSAEQVKAIRKRSSQFTSNRDIAAEFGVSIATVLDVLKRRGAYAEQVTA